MNRRTFSQLIGATTAALAVNDAVAAQPSSGQNENPALTMWYRQPATGWGQALKVGNGRLGATVFGIPEEERVGLNHTWLWRKWKLGGLKNPVVSQHLPAIRQLFFEGKLPEANAAANRLLGSQDICKPDEARYRNFGPDAFQPAGDLNISLPGHTGVTDYRRSLDLSTNIARVTYEREGIRYVREIFASYADDLILIRLSASSPGAISGTVDLFRVPDRECTLRPWASGNRIGFEGTFLEKLTFAVSAQVATVGGKGQARVNPSRSVAMWSEEEEGPRGGGHTIRRVGRPEFSFETADEVLIAIAVATDEESSDPRGLVESQLEKQVIADYAGLADRHRAAYEKLFGRMSIRLEGPDRSDVPTDERLAAYRKGADDPQLAALQFQHYRARLISSSRPGGSPANLTWIWSEMLHPRWSADLHHDNGLNNRYWFAQMTNLAECAAPFFDYMDRCVKPGREAAKNLYGCRGIFIPLTNDTWDRCPKVEPGWDEWTGRSAISKASRRDTSQRWKFHCWLADCSRNRNRYHPRSSAQASRASCGLGNGWSALSGGASS